MANRRPQGYLDNDCEANIDENMCKLIDAINEGGGGGDVVVPPGISKVALSTPSDSKLNLTITFDDKSTKSAFLKYSDFVGYFANCITSYYCNYEYSYMQDYYMKSMPHYDNALNYIAPLDKGRTTLVQVCSNNNIPSDLDSIYTGTNFVLEDSLQILGVPTISNGVKTYPVITLNNSQVVNYRREETNNADETVGVYRTEYYKFNNVSCSTEDKSKPLCLVLTLQQYDPQCEDALRKYCDAPCIIKLADKVSDFDFDNTIIKVQNGGRVGDFIVSLIERRDRGVIRIASNYDTYTTNGIINCYGGSIVEHTDKPIEPKVIFALKNLEDSSYNNYSTPQRLFVKSIALATDLCYTTATVPSDMSTYISGITDFNIDMWIEQFEFKDKSTHYSYYQVFEQGKYKKEYNN